MQLKEAVTRRCCLRKVFLKFSQNSQENTCVVISFLIKLLAQACNFFKKRLQFKGFTVNVANLRVIFLEHLLWLLLNLEYFWLQFANLHLGYMTELYFQDIIMICKFKAMVTLTINCKSLLS